MLKKIDWQSLFSKCFPYIAIVIGALLSCYVYFLPGLARGDDIAFHLSMTNDLLYGFDHGYFSYSTNHLFMGGFAFYNYGFYGPFTHYGAAIFTYLFRFMSATPIHGLKFMVIASGICGGIFMYLLAMKMSKNNRLISLISALLFVFLPYRIFCALCRCAFAESVAMAFIPMIFYGLYSFVHDEEYRVSPYVCLSIGAIIIVLSHAFTALITAIFAALYLLFNIKAIIVRRRNKAAIISLLMSALIICLCVLFYVLNAAYYESTGLYNLSDAERQWTTYEHMAKETGRSLDFSGFLNFIVINNWAGQEFWNNETISSLIFSIVIYFISMILAITVDYLLHPLKGSKYYRHISASVAAFIFPLIFRTRLEIYLAISISLVLYFFISFISKKTVEENKKINILHNPDFYYLTTSLLLCFILLFVPVAWRIVPPILYQGQFAWRMWSITAFLFAMFVTFLLSEIRINKKALVISSVLTCSLLTLSMGVLEKRVFYEMQSDKVVLNAGYEYAEATKYSGAQNEMAPQIFYDDEYVPTYTNSLYYTVRNRLRGYYGFIYDKESYINPVYLEGEGSIEITEYNSPNNTFHVDIASETSLIQFPQIYYATYSVYSEGQKLGEAENIDGLIAFRLNEGSYDIALSFSPCKAYQATMPLFYVGVGLLVGSATFGYIYRKKIKKKQKPEN